ncbi:hypothetical protein HJFPF1_05782 [Paramyrothecium foliicola]|nr:hypothetical protein HJFPF1_05782 [Paramyrothecium foliicola]
MPFPNGPSHGSPGASSGSGSDSTCSLSPAASAFSAMISAFVGSIVTGYSSGWLVAFMTGWIAIFAVFRVYLGGIYLLYRSLTNTWGPPGRDGAIAEAESSSYLLTDQGTYFYPPEGTRSIPATRVSRFAALWPSPATLRGLDQPLLPPGTKSSFVQYLRHLNRDVTARGWIGWAYGAIWAPTTQIIWIMASASRTDNGPAKLVKGLTIAVSALPLCIDCRARYGESLKWGGFVFNVINSVSCLLQAVFSTYLLIRAASDIKAHATGFFPWPLVVVYPIFSLIWMYGSCQIVPVRDGNRLQASQLHWTGYFKDIGMGAFAGIFLAAPALGLYMSAQFDKGLGDTSSGFDDIASYLRCESQAWRKFAAIAP